MIKIDHISYSMLSLWLSCRQCFIRHYINHEPQPPFQPFIDGIKAHENAHAYHTDGEYDEEFLEPYTEKYDPDYRTISETKFRSDMALWDWQSPVPIVGIIDGLRENEVVDLKYSKSAPKLAKNMQGILYSWFVFKLKNEMPLFTINHWHKETNKIKNRSIEYTKDDIRWLMGVIDKFWKEINQDDIFIAGKPGAWNHRYPDCPFQ